jgi:hypothetical protein
MHRIERLVDPRCVLPVGRRCFLSEALLLALLGGIEGSRKVLDQ